MLSVYSSMSFADAVSDRMRWGQFFESAVGAYIVNQAFAKRFEVLYWRDGNDEVDFVIKKNSKVVAIEVKSNGERSTSGLERFRRQFNPHAAFVVGENGIKAEDFLCMDLSKLFE